MKKNFVVFPALVLGMAAMAHAQAPTKVAIIHVQNAILQTKDGQKAATELQGRFAPKKADLDKKQADIATLQDTVAQRQRHHERRCQGQAHARHRCQQQELAARYRRCPGGSGRGTGQDHAGVGQQGDGGAGEVRHRQRLRPGAGRQQSADSGAVGGSDHRYHQRHRETLRPGQPGHRLPRPREAARRRRRSGCSEAGRPRPRPRLLRRRSNRAAGGRRLAAVLRPLLPIKRYNSVRGFR